MKIINVFLVIYIYNLAFTVKGFKVIYYCNELLFFFKLGIHSMQDWEPTVRLGVTRKTSAKRKGLQHTGNLFRKNLQLKDMC